MIYRRIIGDDYVPNEPTNPPNPKPEVKTSNNSPHFEDVTLTPTLHLLLSDSYFLKEVRNCEDQIDEPECVNSASVPGYARSFRLDIDARTTATQF